jgi:uncharacterized membrane protein YeaQ/YmgE (transglycosylase-associated protein family)
MGLILWIIFGALAGWIASMLVRADAEQGALGNIIVGILGALLGGFLSRLFLNSSGITGFNLSSFVIAVLGAIVLLLIKGSVTGKKAV